MMIRETIPRICLAALLIVLPARPADADTPPASKDRRDSSIKVLTFNVMWEENGVRAGNRALPVWKHRKGPVAKLILGAKADIVGLQEASPEQEAGLKELLPDYTLVHHDAVNNTNPILFKTARFRLVDSGAFVLNAKPEIDETNIGVRGSTWACLEAKKSGRRLWIYSLHLDHRSKGPTRQISAVRLVERITKHGDPVFVTGDFNTAESSPTMSFFFGRKALPNDAGKLVTNARPFVTAYKTMHPDDDRRVIDHVLASPGIRIINAGTTDSGKSSDHNIFWAEAVLK